jgi:hypothetical protein
MLHQQERLKQQHLHEQQLQHIFHLKQQQFQHDHHLQQLQQLQQEDELKREKQRRMDESFIPPKFPTTSGNVAGESIKSSFKGKRMELGMLLGVPSLPRRMCGGHVPC